MERTRLQYPKKQKKIYKSKWRRQNIINYYNRYLQQRLKFVDLNKTQTIS